MYSTAVFRIRCFLPLDPGYGFGMNFFPDPEWVIFLLYILLPETIESMKKVVLTFHPTFCAGSGTRDKNVWIRIWDPK
jgi:hypothetical protein